MPEKRESDLTAAESVPATMTAVMQRGYGGPDVFHLERIAVPAPGIGQVLVGIHAAGLDRGVWHIMAGLPYLLRPMFGISTPRTPVPGSDVAGTVVAVGEGAHGLAVGDRVFGTAIGSFAEYAVAQATALTQIPAGLEFDAAAALPVSGVTALEAVRDHGKVQAGQRVLVLGASGGVGGYAVQIAKSIGAEVTGVASHAKQDYVRSLGVADFIDYGTEDVTELPGRYDVIIDINGRLPVGRLIRILTRTGSLVIVGGEGGGRLTGGIQRQFGARIRSVFTRRRLGFFISSAASGDLHGLAALVDSGAVHSTVGQVFPLASVRTAMADLVSGRIRGKAVLHVSG